MKYQSSESAQLIYTSEGSPHIISIVGVGPIDIYTSEGCPQTNKTKYSHTRLRRV